MPVLRWGAASHPGQIREQNEDSFAALDGLFVVADGMGGHLAGEVASEMAVSIVRSGAAYVSADELVAAVQQANEAIRSEATSDQTRRGMGTTVTALALMPVGDDDKPRDLALANVGDSRTYLFRTGSLRRLTVDHSYVQELVTSGQITEEEARLHPRRNIVTRALGIEPGVQVDHWTLSAITGDRYVLCSDGLVDEVPDHEIADLLAGTDDPQAAAQGLVDMANRHGGRDNVTVVVVDVVEGAALDDDLVEPTWAEGVAEPPRWAGDPDPDTDTLVSIPTPTLDLRPASTLGTPAPPSAPPANVVISPPPLPEHEMVPVIAAPHLPPSGLPPSAEPHRRKFPAGAFAFWFLLGAIASVVIVVVALAVTGDDDNPPTPTSATTATSTTGAPTTTRAPTSTTIAASTTSPGTGRPSTTGAGPTTSTG